MEYFICVKLCHSDYWSRAMQQLLSLNLTEQPSLDDTRTSGMDQAANASLCKPSSSRGINDYCITEARSPFCRH